MSMRPSPSPKNKGRLQDGIARPTSRGDSKAVASGNITLRVPPPLHDALLQQAKSRGTTVRAIILGALRNDGFQVAEDDVMDRRTPERVGRKPKAFHTAAGTPHSTKK